MTDAPSGIHADAIIIGAGPVGLYQAFQLGLLGFQCQLIDALPHVGGQCAELYPDKILYDIPGLPQCTGRELIDRLLLQVKPFKPALHLGQLVSSLVRQPEGAWQVSTDHGLHITAPAVMIAAGVGAFVPKTIKLDGLSAQPGPHFSYHLDESASFVGQQVLVLGGDELALRWASRLAELPADRRPRQLDLLYRREQLTAPAALLAHWDALQRAGFATQHTGQALRLEADPAGQIQALVYSTPDGRELRCNTQYILAATGLSPKLGAIADWGLAMDRKHLVVEPASCQTDQAGLFAVGDIVAYPGKKKLIACGFHEAIMAAYAAAEVIAPGQTGPLQYTTSSAILQRRLRV